VKGNADDITEIMRTQPYSIAADGNNDYGAANPIVLLLFNEKFGPFLCSARYERVH